MVIMLFGLVAIEGCTGPAIDFGGTNMEEYFPLEGTRVATYANADETTVPDNLLVEKIEPTEMDGNLEIVTLEQRLDDADYTFVGGVKWSNDNGDVQIHAWAGNDGSYIVFDPPVQVTDPTGAMHNGDTVTTESGGTTFTSTFASVEDCPVLWGPDWEDCLHFTIDDGQGAATANDSGRPIFVGDYWFVTRYMTAWMQTTGWDAKWNLADYDYVEPQ